MDHTCTQEMQTQTTEQHPKDKETAQSLHTMDDQEIKWKTERTFGEKLQKYQNHYLNYLIANITISQISNFSIYQCTACSL